ncbi:Glucose/ribitol dehydrogenase [Cynara cardunculus var. scolymus]|uniref:Glucose/ribitol dehydrogenase n=1 Tax=Cynara cardunculus var. scolymus TaxID=59895 RepID=A0A103YDK8_CYNCS|nr:Glucose/ribitol dehydrogenase [Cynara cardunculus var. scolymus]
MFGLKGPSGFSRFSTAEEVTQGIDGSGLTAIVTVPTEKPILSGASSGIGTETARVLALRGVHVVMAIRNMSAGREAREAILKQNPTAKVDAMELDLSSIASINNFASDFKSSGLPLNVLINNAGILATPYILSKDKIELQFATNHVGHFHLTNLLLETMKKSACESSKEGRIVNVSSRRHQFSYHEGIRFDKINNQSGYNGLSAYGLANIFGKYVLKNVHQGAATTCYVALHPQIEGISGKYFVDSNLTEPSSQANDPQLGHKLWDFTAHLIKENSPRTHQDS